MAPVKGKPDALTILILFFYQLCTVLAVPFNAADHPPDKIPHQTPDTERAELSRLLVAGVPLLHGDLFDNLLALGVVELTGEPGRGAVSERGIDGVHDAR